MREYDEEDLFDDDDREPIPPPSRSRRGRRPDPEMRYNMRAPSPPPMEEFDRLELRDRSVPPEFLPTDFEPTRERRPLPVRREHNGIGVPPRELVRNFERARGEARRHGRRHREVFLDEEYGSPPEELESGPEPERLYVDSDEEDELPPPKERPLPRYRREIREELVPRSTGQKDRRVHRPRLEKDDIHPRPVDIRDEIRSGRGHHHHHHHHRHRASHSHPPSGYQTEVYESTDDAPDEDVIIKKGRRKRDLGRDRFEEEDFIQDGDLSSSEMDDPRAPSPARMPHNHRNLDAEHLHIREGKESGRLCLSSQECSSTIRIWSASCTSSTQSGSELREAKTASSVRL